MRHGLRWVLVLCTVGATAGALAALNRYDARKAILSMPDLSPGKKDVDVVSVSQMGGQATAEVRLNVSLLMTKKGGGWEVSEVRMPDGGWEKVSVLRAALKDLRTVETRRAMLELVAALLQRFRETGDFPKTSDISVLNDVLCPAHLPHPVGFDAWTTPLRYHGEDGAHYRIRSAGPDRKWGTPDDIELQDGRFAEPAR
jgi:hypothetical protein